MANYTITIQSSQFRNVPSWVEHGDTVTFQLDANVPSTTVSVAQVNNKNLFGSSSFTVDPGTPSIQTVASDAPWRDFTATASRGSTATGSIRAANVFTIEQNGDVSPTATQSMARGDYTAFKGSAQNIYILKSGTHTTELFNHTNPHAPNAWALPIDANASTDVDFTLSTSSNPAVPLEHGPLGPKNGTIRVGTGFNKRART